MGKKLMDLSYNVKEVARCVKGYQFDVGYSSFLAGALTATAASAFLCDNNVVGGAMLGLGTLYTGIAVVTSKKGIKKIGNMVNEIEENSVEKR